MPRPKNGKVTPKKFTYTAKDGINYVLTERQKRFCESYCVFGASGIDAVYAAGYKVKSRKVAGVIAAENLIKPSIFEYIHILYKEYGFNDDDVMGEHLFLINQNADLPSKARGIDMYYKKDGGYAPEKHEHRVETVEVVKYAEADRDKD